MIEYYPAMKRNKIVLFIFIHTFTEKAMAPHSSTHAWKIPWAEEPGRLAAVHGVAKSQT